MTVSWPPDYVDVLRRRQERVLALRSDPELLFGALEYYRTRPVEWINDWVDTYDPRNAGSSMPAFIPLILFDRQRDLVQFLWALIEAQEGGLIEKARDMGATWVSCAFSVWLWLFVPGASVGWGSRKEPLVDKIGDPDSIFEKLRLIISRLPREFLPFGFSPKEHATFMKIVNPETGATITGEAGDNIGRGGRKLIYFKDEAAHYERPEKIEAALGDNTNVQIDISSVNGLGNVFHRRREAGVEWTGGAIDKSATNVFVMDWRDHPAKTQAWYEKRKKRYEEEGLAHVFAQEVDRDYAASVEGVIIPAAWVLSAIDAHKKLDFSDDGGWAGALDVADEGMDRNAFAARKGVVLRHAEEWGARDTGETARRATGCCDNRLPIEVQYDCIGVGAGVKAEVNRLADEGLLPSGIRFVSWDAGAKPQNPDEHVIRGDKDTPLNDDFYANLKAQGWWELRRRFEKTHKAVTEGVRYDVDELISIDSALPKLRSLQKELSQPTAGKSARLKLLVDKTPAGARSPNMADAVMMLYWPMQGTRYTLDNL
ncbi:MAG: hypothetical protein A49_14180 [Methyloceanibacter sp.]|nr:MAG: hypothetical protein A49_14180 [Methyloceanibacter sp.]